MRLRSLLVTALLLGGCSAGGGTVAKIPTSPAPSPSRAAPTATATTPAPGDTQGAVPIESNPPGDIPDNVAFIAYTNAAGRYTFTHPEGWTENTVGATATFTDKLNGVQVSTGSASTAPTVASATRADVPALTRDQAAFQLRGITAVTVPAGRGVKIVYRRNSAADPVTGRQYRDEVERYELVSGGRELVVELFGPVGADNVDAYHTMITSLRSA